MASLAEFMFLFVSFFTYHNALTPCFLFLVQIHDLYSYEFEQLTTVQSSVGMEFHLKTYWNR